MRQDEAARQQDSQDSQSWQEGWTTQEITRWAAYLAARRLEADHDEALAMDEREAAWQATWEATWEAMLVDDARSDEAKRQAERQAVQESCQHSMRNPGHVVALGGGGHWSCLTCEG